MNDFSPTSSGAFTVAGIAIKESTTVGDTASRRMMKGVDDLGEYRLQSRSTTSTRQCVVDSSPVCHSRLGALVEGLADSLVYVVVVVLWYILGATGVSLVWNW